MAASSQQAPAEWNVGELKTHIGALASKENAFINDKVKVTIDLLTTLAENLKKTGPQHDAKVAKLREALQGVADVRADVNAHVDAMEQAQEELDMDAEPTDFARVLDDAAGQAAEDHSAHAAEVLQVFDEAVAGGEEIEEDEELHIERGGDIAHNAACPITSIGILDIKEPVQDQKGFVYEKEAIKDHIRNSGVGGEVKCPHHGTNHMVNVNNLKEARAVIKAQRQRKRRQELQSQIPGAAGDDDDVLDID